MTSNVRDSLPPPGSPSSRSISSLYEAPLPQGSFQRYDFQSLVSAGAFSKLYLAKTLNTKVSSFSKFDDNPSSETANLNSTLKKAGTGHTSLTHGHRSSTTTSVDMTGSPRGSISGMVPHIVAIKVVKIFDPKAKTSGKQSFMEMMNRDNSMTGRIRRNTNINLTLGRTLKSLRIRSMKSVKSMSLKNMGFMNNRKRTLHEREVALEEKIMNMGKEQDISESNNNLGPDEEINTANKRKANSGSVEVVTEIENDMDEDVSASKIFLMAGKANVETAAATINVKPMVKEHIQHEIACLQRAKGGEFFINLYDTVWLEREVWIVMEYAVIGDLGEFCRCCFKDGKVPPKLVKWFATPILLALKHLHEQGIIHRDVKDANIVITSAGIPKLCDLGLAKMFEPGTVGTKSPLVMHDIVGSPAYAPPEFHEKDLDKKNIEVVHYDTSFDVWSVGITMLSLLHGGNFMGNPWLVGDSSMTHQKLTKFLGKELQQSYEKNHSYKSLHKKLGILDPTESDSLRMKQNDLTSQYAALTPDKFDLVDFIKRCLVLREQRPTVDMLLQDEYLKTTVKGWSKNGVKMRRDMRTSKISKQKQQKMEEFFGDKEFFQTTYKIYRKVNAFKKQSDLLASMKEDF